MFLTNVKVTSALKYLLLCALDLHGSASSDSGHLREILQEREHAEIP